MKLAAAEIEASALADANILLEDGARILTGRRTTYSPSVLLTAVTRRTTLLEPTLLGTVPVIVAWARSMSAFSHIRSGRETTASMISEGLRRYDPRSMLNGTAAVRVTALAVVVGTASVADAAEYPVLLAA